MNHIIQSLQAADALRVDNGPLLTSFAQEDDGAIAFTWTDIEDAEFNEYVEADALERATVEGNTVTMTNEQGDTIRVELFTLTPYPVGVIMSVEALADAIGHLIRDYRLCEDILIRSLDDLVHDCIGGHYASEINNRGPAHQTHNLMTHGYRNEVIQTLARLAGTGTRTIEEVLQTASLDNDNHQPGGLS
ncbi:hypothetical protein [Marinobacter subterrani]|uniref:hypothetical protein n=1 Tax=Marinobacter subterrani TaxID=1658765 RepID=UPI0023530E20|nr:hypothetical protein [Marinobacter subterrani]